jgi:hypothetical protein
MITFDYQELKELVESDLKENKWTKISMEKLLMVKKPIA